MRDSTKQVGVMEVRMEQRNSHGSNRQMSARQSSHALVCRPQAYVRVFWRLPERCLDGRLVIGLYRLGQSKPEHSIVSKDIQESRNIQRAGNSPTQHMLSGNLRFYAPKGVGRFVFRIYDEKLPESTLATSQILEVDASAADVVKVLKLIFEQLKDKRTAMTSSNCHCCLGIS